MSAAHTPGPWSIGAPANGVSRIYASGRHPDGSGATLIICDLWRSALPDRDAEANARLIAAAPDLLFACRELVGEFDRRDAEDREKPGHFGFQESFGLQCARTAVLAAEGGA